VNKARNRLICPRITIADRKFWSQALEQGDKLLKAILFEKHDNPRID
jgi:hypothetical protein